MFVWPAHEGAVTSVAFVPNGGGLLSTGVDGNLRLWEPMTGSLVHQWKLAETATDHDSCGLIRAVADASGRFAVAATRAGGVQCFDLQTYKVAAEVRMSGVAGMAPAPDGKSAFVVGRVSTSSRGHVKLHQFDYEQGKIVASSRGNLASYYRNYGTIAVHPNGSQVIVNGARVLWPSGEPGEHSISGSSRELAVSGDGDKLFGFDSSRLVVWGFQLGFVRHRLKGHIAPITAITAAPDGRSVWTASADASVRQWDCDSYRCEKWYGLKAGPLGCVAIAPDGLVGAAGSALRGSIAMWDLG
jgi:WD40 repeat protein